MLCTSCSVDDIMSSFILWTQRQRVATPAALLYYHHLYIEYLALYMCLFHHSYRVEVKPITGCQVSNVGHVEYGLVVLHSFDTDKLQM